MITPAARRLRELRKAKGYSQHGLAQKAGVSMTTVRWLETGWSNMGHCKVDTLAKLARALETPLDSLVDAQTI